MIPLTGGRELRFESLSYTDSDGTTATFIVNYQQIPRNAGGVQTTLHNWSGGWNAMSGNRTVAVSHYDSEFIAVNLHLENGQFAVRMLKFETSFSLAGTVTNGSSVGVQTSMPLIATIDDAYYQTGRFVIRATLEDSLTLDFGTGDGSTVMRSLQTALSTEQVISAWQDVAEFRF